MQIILGIDPGSRITGYGVIRSNGTQHEYITSGTIVTSQPKLPQVARLGLIFKGIRALIDQHKPTVAAIESVFMSKNASAALKLGQARGAAMSALAHANLSVSEYAARLVKQAISGYGGADKKQVQYMVKLCLRLSGVLSADAADALAVALCHAQHLSVGALAKCD